MRRDKVLIYSSMPITYAVLFLVYHLRLEQLYGKGYHILYLRRKTAPKDYNLNYREGEWN